MVDSSCGVYRAIEGHTTDDTGPDEPHPDRARSAASVNTPLELAMSCCLFCASRFHQSVALSGYDRQGLVIVVRPLLRHALPFRLPPGV